MTKQLLVFIFLIGSLSIQAQIEKSSELYKTILALDKELFDAYNTYR